MLMAAGSSSARTQVPVAAALVLRRLQVLAQLHARSVRSACAPRTAMSTLVASNSAAMRKVATKAGSPPRKLAVGVVGPGLIGKTLIKQIASQQGYLKVRTARPCSLQGTGRTLAPRGAAGTGNSPYRTRSP